MLRSEVIKDRQNTIFGQFLNFRHIFGHYFRTCSSEFVTDEFQTNDVSISRVYPCIELLLSTLKEDIDDAVYCRDLRKNLIESLNTRFGSLIQNEVYVISTLLGNKIFSF